MRRRELLAGVGALGALGVGGAVAFTDLSLTDRGGVEGVEPVEIQRFEARGSPQGTEKVPEPDRVTFVEMFATWCGICQRNMPELVEAAEAVDDDVQFLSVTNEPVGQTVQPADVVEWFESRGGNWHLAVDDELELSRRVDATGVPTHLVFDAENRITWEKTGFTESDTIVERVQSA